MGKEKTDIQNTITLEFYIDDNKQLNVVFNKREYIFSEFWKNVHDAEKICIHVYNEFKKQYPEKFKTASQFSDDWLKTFLQIINNHLNLLDKILDVFIRSNGEITFHLER